MGSIRNKGNPTPQHTREGKGSQGKEKRPKRRKGEATETPRDGDGEEATEEARNGQKGEKDPNGAREQEGGVEEQQGLRCGEANSNQGLVGTSGQQPRGSRHEFTTM